MRSPRPVNRKNKTRGRYLAAVCCLSVLWSIGVSGGFASQGVTLKGHSYDPTGRIDPFKSFIAEQEAIEEKKKKEVKTYLETLDLSQLDLIAIILSPKGNWAMVRDSKGLGYVIRKGTPIGINGGIVHEIREKEVVIREEVRDFKGGQLKLRDIPKKLYSLP